MKSRDPSSSMWDDALSLLEQAERLHRQFVRATMEQSRCWEPPVDVVETDDAVIVYIALPGVPASAILVDFEPGGITVSGARALPAARQARIHRIEIPYGRFARRIPLPMHFLHPVRQQLVDGCLQLTFSKVRQAR